MSDDEREPEATSEPEPEPKLLELDGDALAMLRAYRSEERIPAAVHDRVWSRVQADVEPSPVRWLRYAAVAGVLAAAAVGVLWMGGQLLRAEPRAPASQAGYERSGATPGGVAEDGGTERATPRERAPGREVAPESAIDEPRVEPAPSLVPGEAEIVGAPSNSDAAVRSLDRSKPAAASDASSSPRNARRGAATPDPLDDAPDDEPSPAPAEPVPGSTLAEENRLLSQAREALIDRAPERALVRLGEHAQRFPAGVLSEERQALRAVALCEAGRDADGDAAARAFLHAHPQAALAERVRSACLE